MKKEVNSLSIFEIIQDLKGTTVCKANKLCADKNTRFLMPNRNIKD
jgi:hypothetical protein